MNYFQRLALRAVRQPEYRIAAVDDPFENLAPWDENSSLPGRAIDRRDGVSPEPGKSPPHQEFSPLREEARRHDAGRADPSPTCPLQFPAEQAVPLPDASILMMQTTDTSPGEPPSLAESLQPLRAGFPQEEEREALALADSFMASLTQPYRHFPGDLPALVATQNNLAENPSLLNPGTQIPRAAFPPAASPERVSEQRVVPPPPLNREAGDGRNIQARGETEDPEAEKASNGTVRSESAPASRFRGEAATPPVIIVQPSRDGSSGSGLGLGAPRFGLGQL